MPIKNMFWSGEWGPDLHIFRGHTSVNLASSAIRFSFAPIPPGTNDEIDWAAHYIQTHPDDVELKFTPLFNGVDNGHLVEGLGLHVDVETGEVRVDAAIPADRKSNFIVEITATNVGDGSTFTLLTRFHIHKKVLNLWITPKTMTVRPANAATDLTPFYRFTVLAEFDDGSEGLAPNRTIGDVTVNHGVTWTPTERFFNPESGFFAFQASDAPGAVVKVFATMPTPDGPEVAQAEFHIASKWASEADLPKVSIVPGGGFPGALKTEAVPNILFIGDGFPASEPFETITNDFVQALKANAMLSPFNVLATSMNFWRSFVAGPQGISVRSEVFVWSDGTSTFARPVPHAVKPPPGTQFYELEHLLYVVGIPTPPDTTKSSLDVKKEWKLVNFPDPTGFLHVGDDSLVDEWKQMGNRAFIDQIDAFPAMCYGSPPSARSETTWNLGLHPDRGDTTQLASLCSLLPSDSGTLLDSGKPLGTLWVDQDPSFNFNNTSLVVLATSIPGGRAVNYGSYIALSTATNNIALPVTPVVGRNAYTLNAIPIDGEASADSVRTLAHELGHSLGLGDEYSEIAKRYPTQDDTLSRFANLTTEQNVFDDAVSKQIVAEEIKWNWHRIAKAAVIGGPITPSGNGFRIPLGAGQGTQFNATGNVVEKLLLRLRKWGEPLQKKPTVLAEGKELKLQGNADADFIVVEPVVPGAVTLAELQAFLPGSIVYAPTLAKPSIYAASPYAGMMVPSVMHEITKSHRPLTDVPCDVNTAYMSTQFPNHTGIDLHDFPFVIYPTVVGLYEGGALHACGVFHPAGVCMMSNSHDDTAWFCAVCKYIIVDFVNPYLHWQIDRGYTFFYPPSD